MIALDVIPRQGSRIASLDRKLDGPLGLAWPPRHALVDRLDVSVVPSCDAFGAMVHEVSRETQRAPQSGYGLSDVREGPADAIQGLDASHRRIRGHHRDIWSGSEDGLVVQLRDFLIHRARDVLGSSRADSVKRSFTSTRS